MGDVLTALNVLAGLDNNLAAVPDRTHLATHRPSTFFNLTLQALLRLVSRSNDAKLRLTFIRCGSMSCPLVSRRGSFRGSETRIYML